MTAPSAARLSALTDDSVRLIHRESDHPAADALREAIAAGVDLTHVGDTVSAADAEVLAPLAHPEKIICIGLNYADHAAEAGLEAPDSP